MRLILLGAPGAGKGTQAGIISRTCGIPTVSTGNILRAAVKAGTELGLAVKDLIGRGELVSDEIILDLVRNRLAEDDCQKGYILDGVPRTQSQAEALERIGIEIDYCLSFEIADQVIIARLSGRRTCRECASTFHVEANPPKQEGVCDHCGGELYTRHDDQADTVVHRLEVFHQLTAPLKDFYKARGKLRPIPSEGTLEETTRIVMETLGVQ